MMKDGRGYVLAIGFGTAVAMWVIGYFCRLPSGLVPGSVLLAVMIGCLLAGGFVAGRYTGDGWTAGVRTGLVTAAANLLILGSLLSGSTPGVVVPSAVWWIPGSLLVAAIAGGAGAWLGSRGGAPRWAGDWTAPFARVAAVATFFLLIVGGIVTGHEAGLAVVDWPNSYGYNMFLYPLSKMTGGIYYEHAHRLFGSLVGLTTLVLVIRLLVVDGRRWLRVFAVAALLAVIAQGIMGGLRVTGTFTTSTSPEDLSPSLTLAVVHGVFGQIFLGMMIAIAVFTSTTWRRAGAGVIRASAPTDRGASIALVALLLVQLGLGARLRHTGSGVAVHITMAVVVIIAAIVVGVRAWELKPSAPVLQRLGPTLIFVVIAQGLLGVAALMATVMTEGVAPRPLVDVIMTTVHQATGAALLAVAVMTMLWTLRLVRARS